MEKEYPTWSFRSAVHIEITSRSERIGLVLIAVHNSGSRVLKSALQARLSHLPQASIGERSRRGWLKMEWVGRERSLRLVAALLWRGRHRHAAERRHRARLVAAQRSSRRRPALMRAVLCWRRLITPVWRRCCRRWVTRYIAATVVAYCVRCGLIVRVVVLRQFECYLFIFVAREVLWWVGIPFQRAFFKIYQRI